MVKKVKGGWIVVSEKGKKLSKVFTSVKDAYRRLSEIEYFKSRPE